MRPGREPVVTRTYVRTNVRFVNEITDKGSGKQRRRRRSFRNRLQSKVVESEEADTQVLLYYRVFQASAKRSLFYTHHTRKD